MFAHIHAYFALGKAHVVILRSVEDFEKVWAQMRVELSSIPQSCNAPWNIQTLHRGVVDRFISASGTWLTTNRPKRACFDVNVEYGVTP